MQAFKTEPVNSKSLQECSKISLIKLPASNHAKLNVHPKRVPEMFPRVQTAASSSHCPHPLPGSSTAEELQPWSAALLPELIRLGQGKEMLVSLCYL